MYCQHCLAGFDVGDASHLRSNQESLSRMPTSIVEPLPGSLSPSIPKRAVSVHCHLHSVHVDVRFQSLMNRRFQLCCLLLLDTLMTLGNPNAVLLRRDEEITKSDLALPHIRTRKVQASRRPIPSRFAWHLFSVSVQSRMLCVYTICVVGPRYASDEKRVCALCRGRGKVGDWRRSF